jgi:ABC-type antimicrobial peptide transport system permease subunit
MFFTYLRRELSRRGRQAVFIALGLALGIGLVITVTAAAAGGLTLNDRTLSGTVPAINVNPGGGGGGGGPFAAFRNASAAAHTVGVHLAASVSTSVIVLAVLLAVAGGIIAGMFGGWRAARLRPADALSKVG